MKTLFVWMFAFAVHSAMAAVMPPTNRSTEPLGGVRSAASENLSRALSLVREGDVIFICFQHALYRRIAETSGSWESHCGIILRAADGSWTVAQSTIPFSRFTSLERFIGRSHNGRFLIRRLRAGLSAEQIQRLHSATARRMGKLYDTGFQYDSSRQFCSKFVHDSYLEATGQPVGRIETFRELFAGNPQAPLNFWRTWFFGRIPWDRRSITTASQVQAPNMITVFDSETTRAGETAKRPGTLGVSLVRKSSSKR